MLHHNKCGDSYLYRIIIFIFQSDTIMFYLCWLHSNNICHFTYFYGDHGKMFTILFRMHTTLEIYIVRDRLRLSYKTGVYPFT